MVPATRTTSLRTGTRHGGRNGSTTEASSSDRIALEYRPTRRGLGLAALLDEV